MNALLADLVRKNPQITNILIADKKGNTWASGLPMKDSISRHRTGKFPERHGDGTFLLRRIQHRKASEQTHPALRYPLRDESGRITDVATVSFSLDKYDRYFPVEGVGP